MKRPIYPVLAAALCSILLSGSAEAGIVKNMLGKAVKGGAVAMVATACIRAAPCRSKGAELGSRAAIALVERFGEPAIKKCISDKRCMAIVLEGISKNVPIPAIVAAVAEIIRGGDTEEEGSVETQPLSPPGNCTPRQYRDLNRAVDRFCKKGAIPACRKDDGLTLLSTKVQAMEACMRSRIKREQMCFSGGDRGHRDQIQDVKNSMAKCYEYIGKAGG